MRDLTADSWDRGHERVSRVTRAIALRLLGWNSSRLPGDHLPITVPAQVNVDEDDVQNPFRFCAWLDGHKCGSIYDCSVAVDTRADSFFPECDVPQLAGANHFQELLFALGFSAAVGVREIVGEQAVESREVIRG